MPGHSQPAGVVLNWQLSTFAWRTVGWPHELKLGTLHQKPLEQQACPWNSISGTRAQSWPSCARTVAQSASPHGWGVRMQETSKQHRAYRNLLLRHTDKPSTMLAEAARSGTGPTPLKLPFILIQVNPEAAVEIQISEDNRQALFDFARYPIALSMATAVTGTKRSLAEPELVCGMNYYTEPEGGRLSSASSLGRLVQR